MNISSSDRVNDYFSDIQLISPDKFESLITIRKLFFNANRNLVQKVETLSKVNEAKPENYDTEERTELVDLRETKERFFYETKGAYYVVLKADNTLEGALKQARKQQLIWQEHQIYVASVDRKKWNFKILVLFPYESMAQNFIDANSSNNFFHLNNEVLAFYQF